MVEPVEAIAKSAKTSAPKPVIMTLTEDQAIELVSRDPKVRAWSKLLRSTKSLGRPGYMATKNGTKWTVQVFESRADQNVTFAFYEVDPRTKRARKLQN
jgi:hypothetical protein